MMTIHHPVIAVAGQAEAASEDWLKVVAQVCGVTFESVRLDTLVNGPVILWSTSEDQALSVVASGHRCLAFVDSAPSHASMEQADVQFSSSPSIPDALRGARCVVAAGSLTDAQASPDGEVWAQWQGRPVWVRRYIGGTALDLIYAAPAVDAPSMASLVRREGWLTFMPPLILAREVAGWIAPPPRACFVIDDPNLHWPSYGFIDYQEVISDARTHGYHVAFATIPLDAWLLHSPTVALFAAGQDVVSLLVHGNNHSWQELLQPRPRAGLLRLATQAIARIESLERRSSLRVAHVMAAPHGACSPEMADALADVGFESACISFGSLASRNASVHWPPDTPFHTAALLGNRLPVLPRLSLSMQDVDAHARLAVLFGQAIVIVGHHTDFREGLSVVRSVAGTINRLFDVHWQNMQDISRSSYWRREEGSVVELRAYSRRIDVPVSRDYDSLVLWAHHDATLRTPVPLNDHAASKAFSQDAFDRPVVTRIAGQIEVGYHTAAGNRVGTVSTPPLLRLRRCACELRDRLAPLSAKLGV